MVDGTKHQEAIGSSDEHASRFPPLPAYRSDFEIAILAYLDLQPRRDQTGKCDGRREAMRQALDGRATYSQIRDWRQGWRKAPTWALQLLTEKLEHRQNAISRGIGAAQRAA